MSTDREKNASISDGLNARPREESIGQSAGGIPDDSGAPVEVDPEEEKRIIEAVLEDEDRPKGANPEMPYDTTHAGGTGSTKAGR